MKVTIDRENCIGCGACEAVCPEVFKLADDGKSSIAEKYQKDGPDKGEIDEEELASCVESARDSCPVEVISIE